MNELELKLQWLQKQLCIPLSLKGYQLFYEAITICYEGMDSCVTKDVYYTLARKYGVSSATIESRIRTIIETLWHNRDLSLFGFYMRGRRPTNKVFLYQIVGYLKQMKIEDQIV